MGERSEAQWRSVGRIAMGAALLTAAPILCDAAAAKIRHPQAQVDPAGSRSADTLVANAEARREKYAMKGAKVRYATATPHLQCVPFARAASGIEIKGNAVTWWDAAAGIYERGSRPEPGSVLNFRATGRMRLGHVAVVTAVVSSREIEIEHANWAGPGANKSGISRNMPVIDVSDANDWSAVRVSLGRSGEFGSIYPTYGFIYDRADRGMMVANTPAAGGSPTVMAVDEVAQAAPRRHIGILQVDPNFIGDGPSRGLR